MKVMSEEMALLLTEKLLQNDKDIEDKLNTRIDSIILDEDLGHLKRSIVTSLPEASSADDHTIYMVEITGGDENQKYEEFMLINGVFEKIGNSSVDLTDYATKEYTDGLNTAINTRVDELELKVEEGFTPIGAEEIRLLFKRN